MGAQPFIVQMAIVDPREAFRAAIEEAQEEYGSRGYTGTIAEKDTFTRVTSTPMTGEDAERRARTLLNHPRYEDKAGPAGAIPVGDDTGAISGWVFFGWAPH
ncbi:hypothetical protein CC117_25775 [Parafrankia colletiae]|uniref:Uncharacterized protein n=1 Tax=Parafrankia colletiae TaxID=573497 RepID=A0A1S1QDD6_9ACTN|nr:hypothetical protein [Parafrankia colletiae]MCK9903600.1 hypothetical protein [Frankia sp. Cpl3]OHV31626.1 hypothetical protein CC117_25775 [Parafrankia colletiae]